MSKILKFFRKQRVRQVEATEPVKHIVRQSETKIPFKRKIDLKAGDGYGELRDRFGGFLPPLQEKICHKANFLLAIKAKRICQLTESDGEKGIDGFNEWQNGLKQLEQNAVWAQENAPEEEEVEPIDDLRRWLGVHVLGHESNIKDFRTKQHFSVATAFEWMINSIQPASEEELKQLAEASSIPIGRVRKFNQDRVEKDRKKEMILADQAINLITSLDPSFKEPVEFERYLEEAKDKTKEFILKGYGSFEQRMANLILVDNS